MIIHINSRPRIEKTKVGSLLATTIGARFVPSDPLDDVAVTASGLDSLKRWAIHEKIRTATYEALSRKPLTEEFVLTNTLYKTGPRDREAWQRVVELAVSRQAPLVPIILEAYSEEFGQREQGSKERIIPRRSQDADFIQYPNVPETFVLDVTCLAPKIAVNVIVAHLGKVRRNLRPAGDRHLVLR